MAWCKSVFGVMLALSLTACASVSSKQAAESTVVGDLAALSEAPLEPLTTGTGEDGGLPPPEGEESSYRALEATATEGDRSEEESWPQSAGAHDPWEKFNRRVHRFNNAFDRSVARPVATAYVNVVPQRVRSKVSNFFDNLGQPATAVNALLQGEMKYSAQALSRFFVNSTVGVAGLFDPASRMNIPKREEDFGQTLAVWGWRRSRYLELPFFGPSTVRDAFGIAGDSPLQPVSYVESGKTRIGLTAMSLVDVRSRLLAFDPLRDEASDDYSLVRDTWSQRRNYQIESDFDSEESLPDYLRDQE